MEKIKMVRNYCFVGLEYDLESESLNLVTKSKNFFNCEDYCINLIRKSVELGEEIPEFYIAQRTEKCDKPIQIIRYNRENNLIECFDCNIDLKLLDEPAD